jgi:glycosyltransferase involved in cell wall biosynthesis
VTDRFSFCVCTYNSSTTIEDCLRSIRRIAGTAPIIVVDHMSTDGTRELATGFGVEFHTEEKSLGYARQLCFDLVRTDFLVFVDSDVEIVRDDFLDVSARTLEDPRFGAVVGMSMGHRFPYGLPASLLVLRKADFDGRVIPDYVDARETYFIQRRLDERELATFYVQDAMIHRSQFRTFKPEWEGANTRILPSSKLKELAFAFKVVVLMSLNSRSSKNMAYIPIFYLKFLEGFANPIPWLKLNRNLGGTN